MRWLPICFFLFGLQAQALCVKYDKANLRSSPSPKAKITWTVPKYTPLLRVGAKGSWYKVKDQDGDQHWVYNQVVSRSMKCVAVKTRTANLRTQPTGKAALGDIHSVDKYTPFQRLDIAENGWYKLKANWGGSYWIHPNLVWRPVRVRGVSF